MRTEQSGRTLPTKADKERGQQKRIHGVRCVWAVLLFLAAVLCLIRFFSLTERMKGLPQVRAAKLESGVSLAEAAAQAEQIRAERLKNTEEGNAEAAGEIILTEAVFWGTEASAVLSAAERGVSTTGDLLFLYGNPQVILPEFTFCGSGFYLDAESADALWGTQKCSGGQLRYQNRDWPCRGTWEGDCPLLIVSGEEALTLEFSRFALDLAAGEEAWYAWSAELPLAEAEWQTAVYSELAALAGDAGLALLAVLLMALFLRFLRTEMQPPRKARWLFAVAVGFLMWIQLFRLFFSFPLDYLPGEWSDFSFWSRLWSEKRQAFSLLWQGRTELFDLCFGQLFRRTLLAGGGGVLMLLLGQIASPWGQKE